MAMLSVGTWWAAIPWRVVFLVLLLALLLAGIIWAIWAWRRKRETFADAGSSVGARLRELWQPFYKHLPMRARHYPTVVVLGEAGVGKTHAVSCHVDWRGQANQFRDSADQGAAMQLYLGPDVVIHELSGPVLRDVSREVKRALHNLWRNMGPSATVVVALDARTLLATPPAAMRELAQLVRGKISLFPQRCRERVDVRLYLSHLDQIEGYEVFASVLGSAHGPLALGELGAGGRDAAEFVAAFDAHLAYALTSRSGEEFDRMLGFYGVLPALIEGLRPVLDTLTGEHEPFADRYVVSGLYLGSLLPRSCVGEPFEVAHALIAASIVRGRRRGLGGSLAMAAGMLAIVISLMTWHGGRVQAAEDNLVEFIKELDECPDVDASETREADEVTTLLHAMEESEWLWCKWTFKKRKLEISQNFEEAIRVAYLEPQLGNNSRVRLLYVTALIYSSKDNELGRLISENTVMWAHELGLTEWVIQKYINHSLKPYAGTVTLPDERDILDNGREWSNYVAKLAGLVNNGLISPADVDDLRNTRPDLLGPDQYEVLGKVRDELKHTSIPKGLNRILLGDLDSLTSEQYEALKVVRETIEVLDVSAGNVEAWGLAQLVTELKRQPVENPASKYELTMGSATLDGRALARVILSSRRHQQIVAVLGRLKRDPPGGGLEFFVANLQPPEVGAIAGYGGGPTQTLSGYYTRSAFERNVAPVLDFAGVQFLQAASAAEAAPASKIDISDHDEKDLAEFIEDATKSYATAYRSALLDYYQSFELEPTSQMTLPFVFKAFVKPSSWFTDFLLVVSRNATLELPVGNPSYDPMSRALEDFSAFASLMIEEGGVLPGLEPYQTLLSALQPTLASAAGEEQGRGEGDVLSARLSPIGGHVLASMQGTATDYDAEVEQWLLDEGLDKSWHWPFRAPVRQARDLGIQDIEAELERAWTTEVRPIVRPLLHAYPFNPRAGVDAEIGEIEETVRRQGKEPGRFWGAFDRLIAPAMVDDVGFVMYDELRGPRGMLMTVEDLERMSRALWDEDGGRVPLAVRVTPHALPKEPYQDKVAAMAYLRSGGSAVYGFNQRPEVQVLELEWWNQGGSVISLEMKKAIGDGTDSFSVEASGGFSFFRLLDLGKDIRSPDPRATITEMAMNLATRCFPGEPSGTAGLDVWWGVPLRAGVQRTVRMTIESDPWSVFAVRDCSW